MGRWSGTDKVNVSGSGQYFEGTGYHACDIVSCKEVKGASYAVVIELDIVGTTQEFWPNAKGEPSDNPVVGSRRSIVIKPEDDPYGYHRANMVRFGCIMRPGTTQANWTEEAVAAFLLLIEQQPETVVGKRIGVKSLEKTNRKNETRTRSTFEPVETLPPLPFAAAPGSAATPPATPTAMRSAPAVPRPSAKPTLAAAGPSLGWTQHPDDSTYWFKGDECITAQDLAARLGATV